jgi:hypothetical protein
LKKIDDASLDPADMARLLSLGRIVIGTAAFIAPRRFARSWTGEDGVRTTGTMAVRGLGARDVALGLGTLRALEGEGPVRVWLEAQALADASDVFSTLTSFRSLPPLRRLVALVTAASGCYIGVRCAGELD